MFVNYLLARVWRVNEWCLAGGSGVSVCARTTFTSAVVLWKQNVPVFRTINACERVLNMK